MQQYATILTGLGIVITLIVTMRTLSKTNPENRACVSIVIDL